MIQIRILKNIYRASLDAQNVLKCTKGICGGQVWWDISSISLCIYALSVGRVLILGHKFRKSILI